MTVKNMAVAAIFIIAFVFATNAFAANFVASDVVQVVNTGSTGLKVRDGSCLSGYWDGTKKYDGSRGSALSGPVWCDGYNWWKIRWEDGREGWSADGDSSTNWLTKVFVSASTKFSIGDKVQTTTGLNVRTSPPDLSVITTVSSGAQGTVLDGSFYGVPKSSSGFFHFWKVDFGSATGWVAENYISKISASVPGAPQSLGASAGDSYIDLYWSAPSSDGGSAILYYNLYRGTYSGGESYYTNIYGTSFRNTIVTNGITYYYKVTAVNSVGQGGYSNEVSATPQGALPNPPSLVSPDDAATLSTTTPAFSWNSVSGADQYGLYVRDTNTGILVFDSQRDGYYISGTSFMLPSGILQNSGNYRWNMRSHNSAGWGTSFSTARTFSVSTSQPPGPPTHVSPSDTSTVTTATPTFNWNAGTTAQSYGLYVRNSDTGALVFDSERDGYTITGTSFTLPISLANGNYRWNMRAFNSAGSSSFTSAWTFVVSVSTTGPPSAPQNLVATAGNSKVDLSWAVPSSDGGSAITGYKIYRAPAIGPVAYIATVTGRSYTDTGLTNGNTYRYAVSAVNSVGESALS
ncbi:MAG: fibronectin type III domain-containing protein, partial [Candidatus Aenigmarchaeota archaeon]|nr:fibronectin type III domain-containing protein [Candidatus Aenigmarchaeota archaeon]